MSLLKTGILAGLRTAVAVAGPERAARVAGAALGKTFLTQSTETVTTRGGAIKFYVLGEIARWRIETFFTKEPETLEWLDRIGSDEVLWDVGANIGLYTLYAAVARKVRVLAFEPSAPNYFLLNRSIEMNGVADLANAYCVALTDHEGLSVLNMSNTELAGAHASFEDRVDAWGGRMTPVFTQGMLGYSIDALIRDFAAPFPNHIKIDVDGIEDRVIRGAAATLRDPRMKSLSIEVEEGRGDDALVKTMAEAGLALEARFRSEGSFFNYHFRRG